MNSPKVVIFLITPRHTDKNKKMLVYAENEEEARICANVAINPMKMIKSGEAPPLLNDNDIYSEEAQALCETINVECALVGSDTVAFKYLGKDYLLSKGFAKAIE